jgi:hypothetical protein
VHHARPGAVVVREFESQKKILWQHIEEEKRTSAAKSALTFGAKQSAHPTSDLILPVNTAQD